MSLLPHAIELPIVPLVDLHNLEQLSFLRSLAGIVQVQSMDEVWNGQPRLVVDVRVLTQVASAWNNAEFFPI
jgi:hypothetical protein